MSSEQLDAQAKWRSEPEIMAALDRLDDFTSMLSQGYAHSKATMDADLVQVLQLATSVSHRFHCGCVLISASYGRARQANDLA